MGIIEGLPSEVQNSIAAPLPVTPPVAPAPQVAAPTAPASLGTEPVDNPQPQQDFGTFAQKLAAAYIGHLAQNVPQPKPSRGEQIVSGVERAASAVGSDMSHANDRPGGFLSGVANVLNARSQRMAGEAQQKFENEEQKRKNDALIALNQAQTVSTMRNIYRQDVELRSKSYQSGADYVKALSANHDVQENITQDELSDLIKNQPNYLKTHYARAVSEAPVLDGDGKPQVDQNGNPVMSPIYTLVSRATKNGEPDVVAVTPEMSGDLKKYLGKDVPVGTQLNTDQFTAWAGKVQGIANAVGVLNKARSEEMSQDIQRQLSVDLQNESVQHAIGAVPGKPLAGLYNASQIADQHIAAGQAALQAAQQKGDQQGAATAQQAIDAATAEQKAVHNVLTYGFSTKDKDDFAKQQETERHNRAEEANKAAELQQKKTHQTVISNLTGGDYLQTLPTAQRGIVQAVGEGRQKLPANRKEALALLEQVHQAYPDFDESKVGTWQKANNEYRGSGKTAVQIVPAYNTALEHMQDLYSNTTPDGIFNPLSKAYQDREIALGYVAREVGKAVSAGAMTQKESEDLLSTLKGGMTPALKRERITKTAQLLHDKIDEYQTKFQESAPSSAVKVPVLISPKAAQSYDFVTGKAQPDAAPQLPPAAVQQLKEGQTTTFANGQSWTLRNGQPVQVQGVK